MKLPVATLAFLVALHLPAWAEIGMITAKTTYHREPAAKVMTYDGRAVTVVFGPLVDGAPPAIGTGRTKAYGKSREPLQCFGYFVSDKEFVVEHLTGESLD